MSYRQRLRPLPSAEELAVMYAEPHDHRRWGHGHHLRVQTTIEMGLDLLDRERPAGAIRSIADLSCGNAAIAHALQDANVGITETYLGDLARGYPIQGPIEETIRDLPEVDLFICSETIEHVDDPDALLRAIRDKTRYLLLSTPVHHEGETDTNAEHLHVWDVAALGEMIEGAGFTVADFLEVPTAEYRYACVVAR